MRAGNLRFIYLFAYNYTYVSIHVYKSIDEQMCCTCVHYTTTYMRKYIIYLSILTNRCAYTCETLYI